jgi:hypothetical protein
LGYRVLHRILDALGGGSDKFDLFVGVIAHGATIAPLCVSVHLPGRRS